VPGTFWTGPNEIFLTRREKIEKFRIFRESFPNPNRNWLTRPNQSNKKLTWPGLKNFGPEPWCTIHYFLLLPKRAPHIPYSLQIINLYGLTFIRSVGFDIKFKNWFISSHSFEFFKYLFHYIFHSQPYLLRGIYTTLTYSTHLVVHFCCCSFQSFSYFHSFHIRSLHKSWKFIHFQHWKKILWVKSMLKIIFNKFEFECKFYSWSYKDWL